MYTVPMVKYDMSLITQSIIRLQVELNHDINKTNRAVVYAHNIDTFLFIGKPTVISFENKYHHPTLKLVHNT